MGIYGFLYDLEERISVCGKEKLNRMILNLEIPNSTLKFNFWF